MMELIRQLFDTLVHLSPASVNTLAHQVGPWLYVILFGIIFAETGLVATPFLPGDSLLFAVGAVAAPGSPINLGLVCLLLIVAAVTGDAINYAIGTYLGPKVFAREDSWLLNRKHLLEAHVFYERYGGVTIILARFMPIIRTFAPFVAGIGRMTYARFAIFNITGGVAWVLLFVLGGRWFGGLETVQKNFHLVIIAIIVISVLPPFVHYLRTRPALGRSQPVSEPAAVGEESAGG
ncbi:MAG: DedA family protein [Planctomycetaceae bacterium]|nr:DedA family protein [Planctomycetaceae bacterium]